METYHSLYGFTESIPTIIYLQCMDALGQAWATYYGKTTYDGYRWYIDQVLS